MLMAFLGVHSSYAFMDEIQGLVSEINENF